ncbi:MULTISPECIES: hypothetical protein [unclassified Stygiolobus]|uniref:hypothetical protein n=1 Tax=unclassified Stygiolobus TaxID=2824672 RepID=UPI00307EF5E6
MITNQTYNINLPSNDDVKIYTVSNSSMVYVTAQNELIQLFFSKSGILNKSYKLGDDYSVTFVSGYEMSPTPVNITTIEVKNNSNSFLLFTPSGGYIKFKDSVRTFYINVNVTLYDFNNDTSTLTGVKNLTLDGILQFPYYYNNSIIVYNSTSHQVVKLSFTSHGGIGGIELYSGGEEINTLIKVGIDVKEMIYLGRLIIISGSNESCVYNWTTLLHYFNFPITAGYNVSGYCILYGDFNTFVININRNINNSETYYLSSLAVIESQSYAVVISNGKIEPVPLSGSVNIYEQPLLVGNSLLAFPENKTVGGLTCLYVVNISNFQSFSALSYYVNTSYSLSGYYYYNGNVYSSTDGSIVNVKIYGQTNTTNLIISGVINITLTSGNYTLILPNGEYFFKYSNYSREEDLYGATASVVFNTTVKKPVTSAITTAFMTTTNQTSINTQIIAPAPSKAVSLPINYETIILIIAGYASIIGAYLYARKRG